jgi:hypothetical protein
LCVALSGCGEDAYLILRLETVPGENPFEGVGVLSVVLEHDQPGHEVYAGLYSVSASQIELPTVSPDGVVRLIVQGYPDEDLNGLLASGSSSWIHVRQGEQVEAMVCFCKLETLESGDCDCTGSDS